MPLFEILAIRNDGMDCGGTVDCETLEEATKMARETFRTFTARNGVACPIPGHKHPCYLHKGQVYTFSKIHAVPKG